MAKIIIEVNEKEYALEFDRNEIRRAENMKFDANKLGSEPYIQMTTLFRVALHKNHPNIGAKEADKLFDTYLDEGGDMQDLMELLLEQYSSFFSTTQANTVKKARVE